MGQAFSFIDVNDYPLPDGAGIATQQAADAFLVPLLVGYTINLFLTGCATPWLANWLSVSATGERRLLRWLVIVASVLVYVTGAFNVLQIALHGSSQARDFDSISATPWYDLLGQTIGSHVNLLAQAFFARRTFIILPRRWQWPFAVLAGLLALASYAANLVGNIAIWQADGMYDDSVLAIVLPTAWLQLAAGSAVDMLISLLLVGRLVRHRRSIKAHVGPAGSLGSEAHKRTLSWTRTLLQTSLATAAATTIVQTLGLIFSAIDPYHWNGSGAFMAMLPGLYFLSMIGTLVLRDDVRAKSLSTAPNLPADRGQKISPTPKSARTAVGPLSPDMREPIHVLHFQLDKSDHESDHEAV